MTLVTQSIEFLFNRGLIPYVRDALDYLRRAVLGDPPPTGGVGNPYTPPFKGGQCNKPYTVYVSLYQGGSYQPEFSISLQGPIGSPISINSLNGWGINYNGGQYQVTSGQEPKIRVVAQDGVDDCGDPSDPNGTPSPSSDGLASSAAPDFSRANPIITGTPTANDGSSALTTGASSDFANAGAVAATDVAAAVAKLAAGLAKLATYFDLLNTILDLLKKLLDNGNKSSFSYDFGNLVGDGFVTLLAEPPPKNVTPLYLDIQVTSVRIGASRQFGSLSPNYYNREPIGLIHFVSPTFGVLETHEIRFVRCSFPIPALAYGFFYNMGLDRIDRANATAFYIKEEE